jgi:hypothetical protein
MEMFGGDPLRFHVHGMRGTPLQAAHGQELWNYFFRAISAFALAAKAFGDENLFNTLREYHAAFDTLSGDNAQ